MDNAVALVIFEPNDSRAVIKSWVGSCSAGGCASATDLSHRSLMEAKGGGRPPPRQKTQKAF